MTTRQEAIERPRGQAEGGVRRERRNALAALAGVITFGALMLLAIALSGCTELAPADHTAPDLGECVGLAASDGGVAHVFAYPNGHPCEGGSILPEQGSRARVV